MKGTEALRTITHELYNLELLKGIIEIVETGGTSGVLYKVKFKENVMVDPDTLKYLKEWLDRKWN